MTEQEYILMNVTTWDKIRSNFIFLPALLVMAMVLCQVYELDFVPVIRLLVVLFIASLTLTIILRFTLSKKIERLKSEYNIFIKSNLK
jgi:hypothetical protein